MNLANPDTRRGLRSFVQAIVALAIIALLYWLTHLMRGDAVGLRQIAQGALLIVGLGTVFYGAENVGRAFDFKGPGGFEANFSADGAPQAAQAVADTAQATADQIKGDAQ